MTGPATLRTATALIALTCLLAGAIEQSGVFINHDVAWVLHSAGWMLDGQEFGRDIVAANPPLIWYVSLPAAWLARVAGIPDYTAMRVLTLLVIATSLVLAWRALEPWRRPGQDAQAAALVAGAALALAALAGPGFAQREHLSIALGLPYLALAAARFDGARPQSRWLPLVAGVLAGVGFGFKPTLLAVPACVEVVLLARGGRRGAIRRETVAMAATLVAYLAIVVGTAPDYLARAVPEIRNIYWGFEHTTLASMLRRAAPSAVMLAIATAGLAAARGWRGIHVVLTAAFAGSAFNLLLQAKNYSYHAYPLFACAVLLLATALAGMLAARAAPAGRTRATLGAVAAAAAIVALGVAGYLEWHWYVSQRRDDGPAARLTRDVIARVSGLLRPDDRTVYALSTHPFPGFPMVNYTGATWGSRSNSRLEVPAFIKARRLTDPRQRAEVIRVAARFRQATVAELAARRPRVVLVDARTIRHAIGHSRFEFIEYYRAEPGFDALWSQYDEQAAVDGIRVFVRRDGLPGDDGG